MAKDIGASYDVIVDCSSSTQIKQRVNSESVRSTQADESIELFLDCFETHIGVPPTVALLMLILSQRYGIGCFFSSLYGDYFSPFPLGIVCIVNKNSV